MRSPLIVLASIAILVVAGCGKGADVTGNWTGKVTADPGFEKSEEFIGAEKLLGTPTLNLKADKTFSGSMWVTMEGSYTTSGNQVTLTITKAAGLDSKSPDNKPLGLTVSADGKSMTAEDEKSAPAAHVHLTFTKQG